MSDAGARGTATPLPDSATEATPALVPIVNVAVPALANVGANRMLTVHDCAATSAVPTLHEPVGVKSVAAERE